MSFVGESSGSLEGCMKISDDLLDSSLWQAGGISHLNSLTLWVRVFRISNSDH